MIAAWVIDRLVFAGNGAVMRVHKLAAIETVLGFYPGFRFLLIGDNGQQDVEIYAQAVRDYPDRIGAVFIRDGANACGEGVKAELLAGIKAAGIPTFCGASFDEAVAVAQRLDLDRPLEAAKAIMLEARRGAGKMKGNSPLMLERLDRRWLTHAAKRTGRRSGPRGPCPGARARGCRGRIIRKGWRSGPSASEATCCDPGPFVSHKEKAAMKTCGAREILQQLVASALMP